MLKFKDLEEGKKYELDLLDESNRDETTSHEIIVLKKGRKEVANLLVNHFGVETVKVKRILKKYSLKQLKNGKPFDDYEIKDFSLACSLDEGYVIDEKTSDGNLEGPMGDLYTILKKVR